MLNVGHKDEVEQSSWALCLQYQGQGSILIKNDPDAVICDTRRVTLFMYFTDMLTRQWHWGGGAFFLLLKKR
jgi:hypothetical protein